MLDGLRIMSKNVFGRAILALFAGLIVVGFGIWGIRDMFTNIRGNELARVGDTEISVQQFRTEYQNQLQRLQRQARRAITNDEARQFGLDRQVLSELVTGAALDQDARRLGLGLSDAEIARMIRAEKMFAGPSGAFDEERMKEVLRDNGYTETSYVREQRQMALRQQIAEAATGSLRTPDVLLAAVNTFANQTRKADFFVLPAPDLAKIAAPSDEAVKSFYDLRKDTYRSPEYRTANVLIVAPGEVAKSIPIADEAARKVYDQTKGNYVTPEKRSIALLTFENQAAAAKARARIEAGESFDAVAADKSAGGVLADIGATTKASMFDPAIAQAAFALPQAGVTAPIAGKFGFVLAQVSQIEPGATKPFNEVKEQIKADLAAAQAKKETQNLHDKIEDLRTSGKTLAQAADSLGLKTRTLVTDAAGAGKGDAGQPGAPIAALAAAPELTKAIFASDVGVDNDAVPRKDGGYDWFEITSIDPSRQLPLDEVRPQVVKALQESEAQKQVAAKANELARKIDGGASLAALASENGASAQQAAAIKRAGAPGLTPEAAQQIFGTPVGGAGVALADKGGRIVFKVTDATTPPLDFKNPTIAGLAPQLQGGLADDLFSQYVSGLQTQLGAHVNQTALRAASGQE
ncbi:MAG TPA: SurA N-terminal domain-containing protein [Rhodoblastus sp.]|nr:SurA N-terminal domain-containing protein [Rhodoblastus sp.]